MKKIDALNDTQAIRVLRLVVGELAESAPTVVSPEMREALTTYYGSQVFATTTDGDLARASLSLLSGDPEFAPRVMGMIEQAKGERFFFGPVSNVVVIILALCALQTQVELSWDKHNGLRIALKKKAFSDALLKQFLGKLLGYLPSKAGKDE